LSSDPAIFNTPKTPAGYIVRWCIGLLIVPIGMVLTQAEYGFSSNDLWWLTLFTTPLAIIFFGLMCAFWLPVIGWIIMWLGSISAMVLYIGLFLTGFYFLVTFPIGLIGLISCAGINKALTLAETNGVHGEINDN
jgi:hypothetical protein